MNVRQMWAAKLSGAPMPAPKAPPASRAKAGRTQAMFSLQRTPFVGAVLGIDPSLRGTGLALVEFVHGRQPVLLKCRTVKIPASRSMSYALGEIHRAVATILTDYRVRHVALEQTIFVQNFQTAQILGAARGAAISAAALAGLEIFEYAPLRVKQAVTGVGRASKEQVARSVMAMLGHGSLLASDEADAAGVALCHAFTWRE